MTHTMTNEYAPHYRAQFVSICKANGWYTLPAGWYNPFVVKVDGKVVGFFGASGADIDNYCCLFGLYIKPKYRGKGYGKCMLEAALMRYAKCDKIYWFCTKDNTVAINLYKQYADIVGDENGQYKFVHKN